MFGQWPSSLRRMPVSEFRMLRDYYLAVKEAEKGEDESPPDL